MILKMDKYRGNIVVSRKAISDIETKKQREKLLSSINEESILEGKIKNIFFGNPCQTHRLVRFNNACCTMDFTFD